MKININHYRSCKELLQHFLNMFPNSDKYHLVTEFSATQGIPLIIVYYFLGEIIGFNDKILKEIENHKKFYDIKELIGEKYE